MQSTQSGAPSFVKERVFANTAFAFEFIKQVLEQQCHRTVKTTHALIALSDAREQALTQIKIDFAEIPNVTTEAPTTFETAGGL